MNADSLIVNTKLYREYYQPRRFIDNAYVYIIVTGVEAILAKTRPEYGGVRIHEGPQ